MNLPPKQCELCLKYCDAGGVPLLPQPSVRRGRIGVPEPCVCAACHEQARVVSQTGRGSLPGIDRD